jgi:hypothetical protein
MKYEALQERVGERFSMLLDARTTKVNEYFPDYTVYAKQIENYYYLCCYTYLFPTRAVYY